MNWHEIWRDALTGSNENSANRARGDGAFSTILILVIVALTAAVIGFFAWQVTALNTVNTDLRGLQGTRAELVGDIERLRENRSNLVTEIEGFEAARDGARADAEQENRRAERSRELADVIEAQENNRAAIQRQADDARAEQSGLMAEITRLENERIRLAGIIDDLGPRAEDLQRLETRLSELQSQIESRTERRRQLDADVASGERDLLNLNSLRSERDDLIMQRDRLGPEVSGLEARERELRGRIEQQEAEALQAQAIAADARADASVALSDRATAEGQLAATQSRLANLEAAEADLTRRVAELETSRAGIDAELQTRSAALADARAALEDSRTELLETRTALDAQQRELSTSNEDLTRLRTEREMLSFLVGELETEAARIGQSNSQLTSSNSVLAQQIAATQQQAAEVRTELASQLAALDDARARQAELAGGIGTQTERLAALQAEADVLEAQNARLASDISGLNRQRDESQAELSANLPELANARNNLENARMELASIRATTGAANVQIEQLTEQKLFLEARIAELEGAEANLRERLRELNTQIGASEADAQSAISLLIERVEQLEQLSAPPAPEQ